jgi:hypothetical protein
MLGGADFVSRLQSTIRGVSAVAALLRSREILRLQLLLHVLQLRLVV